MDREFLLLLEVKRIIASYLHVFHVFTGRIGQNR